MTDELRALMRAETEAESPPPMGDVVGDAMRVGRRQRRNRRLALLAAAAAALALIVVASAAGVAIPQPAAEMLAHRASVVRAGS